MENDVTKYRDKAISLYGNRSARPTSDQKLTLHCFKRNELYEKVSSLKINDKEYDTTVSLESSINTTTTGKKGYFR